MGFLARIAGAFFDSLWTGINKMITSARRDKALTVAGSAKTANKVYEETFAQSERARHVKDRIVHDPRFRDRVRKRFDDS